MGIYLNTGIKKYSSALHSRIYVDKTGLLEYTNSVLETEERYLCVSRPRRFGKSMAAAMLSAYYGKGADSSALFEGKAVARSADYQNYQNKYDVVEVDMNVFRHRTDAQTRLPVTAVQSVLLFQQEVIREIREAYPEYVRPEDADLPNVMARVHARTGALFIVIIDEWDTIFREDPADETAQELYLQLLRGLFKDAPSKEFLALGYLTGILPVKKYGTQSALNNFDEFTMLNPQPLEEYVGFTESEVQALCREYHMEYDQIRQWYDGYQFNGRFHIYNPKSVVDALRRGKIDNYWTRSETYESLRKYISMNFDGLKDDVIEMLGGGRCRVNPDKFQNDMVTFRNRDDVFALLIHLGYLAFNHDRREVYIPNAEIRSEFVNAVEGNNWNTVIHAIEASEKLLQATLRKEEQVVADAVSRVHMENVSILKYNDENSLSCVITLAYYSAMRDYILIRELPSGEGFADIAFLPRFNTGSPALLVELKYNHTARSAISQIKSRNYAGKLMDYTGNVLLVGISYDARTKKHTCTIEDAAIH